MIYLFYGDEDFLIAEEVKSLKEKFKEYSIEKFDEIPIKNLVENLLTPSLFTPNRLILSYRNDFSEDEETLNQALQNPDSNVELVFISPDRVDRRKKIFKLIGEIGEVKEFKSFAPWEENLAVAWVIRRVNSLSKKIDSRAAALLVEISGMNLAALNSEIEKLAVYTGEDKNINESHVLSVSSQKEVNIFSFIDALKEKKLAKALTLMEKILNDKEPIVPLISAIFSQFKALLNVKLLQMKGENVNQISRELQYSPFYIKKCLEQSKRFSLPKLRALLEYIYASDLNLKKGGSERVILPLLVSNACHG